MFTYSTCLPTCGGFLTWGYPSHHPLLFRIFHALSSWGTHSYTHSYWNHVRIVAAYWLRSFDASNRLLLPGLAHHLCRHTGAESRDQWTQWTFPGNTRRKPPRDKRPCLKNSWPRSEKNRKVHCRSQSLVAEAFIDQLIMSNIAAKLDSGDASSLMRGFRQVWGQRQAGDNDPFSFGNFLNWVYPNFMTKLGTNDDEPWDLWWRYEDQDTAHEEWKDSFHPPNGAPKPSRATRCSFRLLWCALPTKISKDLRRSCGESATEISFWIAETGALWRMPVV